MVNAQICVLLLNMILLSELGKTKKLMAAGTYLELESPISRLILKNAPTTLINYRLIKY